MNNIPIRAPYEPTMEDLENTRKSGRTCMMELEAKNPHFKECLLKFKNQRQKNFDKRQADIVLESENKKQKQ
jgi:hypothetical protein